MTPTAWRRAAGPLTLLALVAWSWHSLELGPSRFDRAGYALHTFVNEFWPPDFTLLPLMFDLLVETLQIALIGTVLGTVLSLPLGLLAATTLFPLALAGPVRLLATALRVPPSILWAILFVVVLGVGPLAGVAAIALYTAGFLAKLQYETFEGVQRDPLEALRAMGASRFQVAWHAALPEAANALRAQALFMFEYNVRASTIIGIVGAGGIGQLVRIQLQFVQYDRLMATLLVIYAAVLVIDVASLVVRRRFIESPPERSRWREVLTGLDAGRRRRPADEDEPGRHNA